MNPVGAAFLGRVAMPRQRPFVGSNRARGSGPAARLARLFRSGVWFVDTSIELGSPKPAFLAAA